MRGSKASVTFLFVIYFYFLMFFVKSNRLINRFKCHKSDPLGTKKKKEEENYFIEVFAGQFSLSFIHFGGLLGSNDISFSLSDIYIFFP